MLVPRAFASQEARRSSPPKGMAEKSAIDTGKKQSAKQTDGWRGFGWRPESFHRTQAQQTTSVGNRKENTLRAAANPSRDRTRDTKPLSSVEMEKDIKQADLQDAPRSNPVAVPFRPSFSPTSSQSFEKPRRDPRLPASVKSVLDSTSIPRKSSFPRPRSIPTQASRRMSTQQLMDEWKNDEDLSGTSLSSSPNLDLLLSPPEQDSNLPRNESSDSFEVYSRSTSSDSVPTVPFLEVDEKSDLSASLPSTPSPSSQRKSKNKLHLQRQVLTQDVEHPLSPPQDDGLDDYSFPTSKAETVSLSSSESSQTTAFRPSPRTSKPSSFKSNLTASLTNLGNSIRTSLSNFSAPSPYVLPEDHLSRGFFGASALPIRSEMRPRPLEGPPTPQMRRYMNPSSYYVPSPAHDFHLHGRGRSIGHVDLEAATAISPGAADEPLPTLMDRDAVIPLQTYHRPRNPKDVPKGHASTRSNHKPNPMTEAGRALCSEADDHQPQYRRELRENGEFLRVCILEMNMRRAGKLNDGPGRARLWLPPRSESESNAKENEDAEPASSKNIPKRWIAISAPS